jgi:hypothetical protein
MKTSIDLPRSNPFSTRFIRPGAIPFLFDCEETAGGLLAMLVKQRWNGQILGPHGTGKTTLLATLEVPLRAAGRRSYRISLHDGECRLPRGWVSESRLQQVNQVIVDGYEQLSFWQRWSLRNTCFRAGWGLLVTSHQDIGLPTLFNTTPHVDRVIRLVALLLAEERRALASAQIEAAYYAARGDVRETLFRLYDVWEAGHRRTTR